MKKYIFAVSFLTLSATSLAAYGASCKSYFECRQAVIAWCEGSHPRADGDKDGIPCENVCKSLKQVEQIRREISC